VRDFEGVRVAHDRRRQGQSLTDALSLFDRVHDMLTTRLPSP
jgi:hypothetical protein